MDKSISEKLNTQEYRTENLRNRRDFIKCYGKYAAATPVAMTTLMTPNKASAACSEGITVCRDTCTSDFNQCRRECPPPFQGGLVCQAQCVGAGVQCNNQCNQDCQ